VSRDRIKKTSLGYKLRESGDLFGLAVGGVGSVLAEVVAVEEGLRDAGAF
jgi:hypothetical protein